MNVKRILASVLSAVFVFNTVADPLTSMAKEPESATPQAEFQDLIYDDEATFDQYAEVFMGPDGFYGAYANVTIPERAQFLEKLSDDEMYQLKLFAKYGIVDDLIALGEEPTVDDLEPVFAHTELYAEIPNPEVKDKKALDKKVCEWMAKSYQKEYHDFDSYHEFLQSMAKFDVKEFLEWVDVFTEIDEEHLGNTLIEFRSYVYAIYGFDEEDTGTFGIGGDGDTSNSIENIVSEEEAAKIEAEKKEKEDGGAKEDEAAPAAESRAINKVIFGNTPTLPVDNYFAARFIPNVTKEQICNAPSGAYWDKTSSGTYELVESGNHQMSYKVKDSDKGKIWIRYNNVGQYNGQTLDMKITAVNWQDPRRMQFGWNKLGAGNSTFTEGSKDRWIQFKVEYFQHGTNTLVSGLKGHQTLDDMDWIDGPEYWGGGTNCSSTVYMSSSDSQVLTIDGNLVTVNKKHGGTGMSDGADFIYLFNGPSHEFKWYGGFCGLSSADCPAQEYLIKYMPNGGQGYMEPTRVKFGVETATRRSTFTRSGYRQNGWIVYRDYDDKWAHKDANNNIVWKTGKPTPSQARIYANGCTVSETTYCGIVYFYANWEKIDEPEQEHYVAFDTQGGHIKPGVIRNGKYRIQYSGDSSRAIHLKDGNAADGTEMVIWTGTGSSQNTDWYFERYKDTDYYYIMNAHRTKYIKTSGTYNGAPTLQQKPNNTNNDPYLWKVVPEGSSYSFVNKQSGYAWDLPNGNTTNGQRIQEHTVNHSTAEKWNLLPSDTTKDYPTKKKVRNCYFWITDSIPVKNGYEFVEWNTSPNGYGTSYAPGDGYTPDQNGGTVTLYAIWEGGGTPEPSGTYQVRYNANGGSGYMQNSTHTIGVAKNLSRNQFYRDGYRFAGWSTYSNGFGERYSDGESVINLSTTPGATVNLYAQWERESGPDPGGTYQVEYDSNCYDAWGSMSNSTHTIGVPKNLSRNQYYRDGYRFTGWNTYPSGLGKSYSDGESVVNLSTTPGDVVTLYAQWEPESGPEPSGTYEVKYNGNGGYGSMANSVHTLGVGKNLSPNQFYRSGYRFAGWNTNRNGYGDSYADEEYVIDLATTPGMVVNLYAQWVPDTPEPSGNYTVRYDKNGGLGYMEDSVFQIDASDYLSPNEFYRSGYEFTGWNTDPYGYGDSYRDQQLVRNLTTTPGATVTLYAQWKKTSSGGTYTVQYNSNGGWGTMSDSIHTIGVAKKLNKNEFYRAGYTFMGWNTNPNGFGNSYEDEEYVKDLTTVPGTTITLYAQWEREVQPGGNYTVYYDKNGGAGYMQNSTHTIGVGQALNKNQYYRDGYTFVGWNTNPNGYGDSYADQEYVIDLSTTPGDVVTLYAQWERDPQPTGQYTVHYDKNGGLGYMEDQLFTIGAGNYLSPNEFYRTGYVFKGWNTSPYGYGDWYADEEFVRDLTTTPGVTVTLYAQWEQTTPSGTYTVTYNSNGGYGTMSDSIHTIGVGKNLNPNKFYRPGYVFKGWNTYANGYGDSYKDEEFVKDLSTMPGDIITLYAQWEKEQPGTYTVVYDANGGQGYTPSSIHEIGVWRYLNKNQFYRNGYTFKGWNTSPYGTGTAYRDEEYVGDLSNTPGATVTLYAQWELEQLPTYTVRYNANGGRGTMSDSIMDVDTYEKLRKNEFTRDGYTFEGWNRKPDGSGMSYTDEEMVMNLTAPGETVTLYAQWKQDTKSYTVRYDANGGSGYMSSSVFTVGVGNYLRKNAFYKDGYTFKGWNTDPYGNGDSYYDGQYVIDLSTTDGAIVTLYAQWERNLPDYYTVRYDANGGNGQMSDSKMSVDTYEKLSKNQFVKEGYEFTGWNRKADGNGMSYSDEEYVMNLTGPGETVTLYAQWKKVEPSTYTIHYDANGGDGVQMKDSVMQMNTYQKLTKNQYFRDGYLFMGWNLQRDGSGMSYVDEEMVKNLTTPGATVILYAQWKPVESDYYYVAYDANGGEGTMPTYTFKMGQSCMISDNRFTRDGYNFKEWNTRPDGSGTAYEEYETVSNITSVPGSTVTLYAQWVKVTGEFTVRYHSGGGQGTMPDSQHSILGSSKLSKNKFTYEGHKFLGWGEDPYGTGVSYKDEGYIDGLRHSDGDVVDLYARWEEILPDYYTIRYDANGGTGQMSDSRMNVNTYQKLSKNQFVREGYTFTGWNLKPAGDGMSYADEEYVKNLAAPGQTATLYAQWKENEKYGIYFEKEPYVEWQDTALEWTASAVLKTINEKDKIVEYSKWIDTNLQNTEPTTWNSVEKDYGSTAVTLSLSQPSEAKKYDQYAHFAGKTEHGESIWGVVKIPAKKLTYTVTYHGNGSTSGTTPDSVHTIGEGMNLTKNGYEKENFKFVGWNTEANGSGTSYKDQEFVTDLTTTPGKVITLYAQWVSNTVPPIITVPDPSKTFYEGTTVTREDLLEGITADDGAGVDITKDLKITKIEYAEGRLINGVHQKAYTEEWKGGMPAEGKLDTWFMELDKELSPVKHKVTFEVTNAAGQKATATQDVFVKYNEFPTIQAKDRYFTLEEAQAGKITDKVLREDAIKAGELRANDAEEGDFSNPSKITLLDFDAEEFKNLTEAGFRKLTFHVQDTYGPEGKGKETLCQITVYVMEAGEVPEPEKAKVVRFIDEKYYNLNKDCDPENMTEEEKAAAHRNGGLNVNSKWYRNEEYRTLIEGTFRKTSGTRYRYKLEDLNAMRAFVDEHGPGNAAEPDALAKFIERFMTGKYLVQ